PRGPPRRARPRGGAGGGRSGRPGPALPTPPPGAPLPGPGAPRQAVPAPASPAPPSPARSTHASALASSILAPSARIAAAISSVSLARSGLVITVGPPASAARTSARLVTDFEPGGRSRACTGPAAGGACQSVAGPRRDSPAPGMVRAHSSGPAGAEDPALARPAQVRDPGAWAALWRGESPWSGNSQRKSWLRFGKPGSWL